MLKRVGSIVLTVAMLLTLLCNVTVASAAGEKPQLELSLFGEAETKEPVEVERGEEITLLVSLKNYVPALAIIVDGTYDADTLTSPAFKTNFVEDVESFTNDAEVYAVWASPTVLPAIEELFTISFTVADDAPEGVTEVTFSIEKYSVLADEYEQNLTPSNDYIVDATLKLEIGHDFGNNNVQKPNLNTAKEDAEHKQYCEDEKCKKDIYTPCDFEVTEVVPPSCAAEGYTRFTCKVCGYEVDGEFVRKEDHKFSEWKENTPEAGKHTRTCENGCGTSEVEACDYVSNTPANCTDAEIEVCQYCGGTAFGDPATDHNWDETWKNVSGTKTHRQLCQNANCPDGAKIEDCDIKLLVPDIPASCTTGGQKVYKCTVNCGYERVEKSGALGHIYVTNAGGKTHSCTRCNELKNVACTFNKTIQSGNCVTDTIQECLCGNRKVTKATGVHPESKKVIQYKAPSAQAAGYIQLICKDCNTKLSYAKNATMAKGKPFNDTASDAWFYDQAVFAKSFGLILGDDLGNFNGNNNLTRGQTVTILGRYIWGNLDQMSEKEFNALIKTLGTPAKLKDLKGSYYDRYAIALSTIGVVMGSDGYFNGDDNVTREQLAAFFIRYIDYIAPGTNATYGESNSLSDMNTVSPWFKDVAARAVKTGLIGGMDGKFNPKGNATRAQMATIMERVVRAHSQYPIVNV